MTSKVDPKLADRICYFVDKGIWRSILLTDISSLFPSREAAEEAIHALVQEQVLTEDSEGRWIVVTAWSLKGTEPQR